MKRLTGLLLFILLTGFSAQVQITEVQEYSLKAAFIYHFTKYISWNNYSGQNEFVIGILGSSRIKEPLKEIANSKTVDNKKIVIREYSKPQDLTFCNILFISHNSNYPLSSVLPKVSPKGT